MTQPPAPFRRARAAAAVLALVMLPAGGAAGCVKLSEPGAPRPSGTVAPPVADGRARRAPGDAVARGRLPGARGGGRPQASPRAATPDTVAAPSGPVRARPPESAPAVRVPPAQPVPAPRPSPIWSGAASSSPPPPEPPTVTPSPGPSVPSPAAQARARD